MYFHCNNHMFILVDFIRTLCIFLVVSNHLAHSNQSVCQYEQKVMDGVRYIPAFKSVVFVTFWSGEVGFTYSNGVLITPQHVLTTAQFLVQKKCGRNIETRRYECVLASASEYEVVAGRSHIISGFDEYPYIRTGEKIAIHPMFKEDFTYGIGILTLQRPFKTTEQVGYHPVKDFRTSLTFYMEKYPTCKIMSYGQSTCTKTFTQRVRKNKYTFKSGEKFQHLYEIEVVPLDENDRVNACDDMLSKYNEANRVLNKEMLICGKTKVKSDDCDNFGGSVLWCDGEISGFVLEPITCHYTKLPMIFLQIGLIVDWINMEVEMNLQTEGTEIYRNGTLI